MFSVLSHPSETFCEDIVDPVPLNCTHKLMPVPHYLQSVFGLLSFTKEMNTAKLSRLGPNVRYCGTWSGVPCKWNLPGGNDGVVAEVSTKTELTNSLEIDFPNSLKPEKHERYHLLLTFFT